MHYPKLGIASEGLPFIILSGVSALVFSGLGWSVLAIFALILCWYSAFFFRDPERITPQGLGLAVSPADGKIIRIEKRSDPISNENMTCVSIFMSLFNVHVNRSPITSTVKDIRYINGKFFNASFDKASKDNERCIYSLMDDSGASYTMVQIAGLIARRIVCNVKKGDKLQIGQRYGMIRFGSCLELYFPDTYSIKAHVGDRVTAGESIIASKYK